MEARMFGFAAHTTDIEGASGTDPYNFAESKS
jgi:hypothetical protein